MDFVISLINIFAVPIISVELFYKGKDLKLSVRLLNAYIIFLIMNLIFTHAIAKLLQLFFSYQLPWGGVTYTLAAAAVAIFLEVAARAINKAFRFNLTIGTKDNETIEDEK